ncbi:hypothetical protein FALBO_17015, partial [Fusarium albosuccineum]
MSEVSTTLTSTGVPTTPTTEVSISTDLSTTHVSSTEGISTSTTKSESTTATSNTTELSSIESDTTLSVTESTTTTAESSTTESTTTTTTTSEAPDPTFLVNAGFDDSPGTTDPWTVFADQANEKLLLDSDIQHDGPNSGLITWAHTAVNYIRQPLASTPEADVPYTMSAWVRVSDGGGGSPACSTAFIVCGYGTRNP